MDLSMLLMRLYLRLICVPKYSVPEWRPQHILCEVSLIPAAPGSITNASDIGVLLGWSQPSVIPQFRCCRVCAYPKEGKWTPQATSRRRVWRRRWFQSIGSPVSCQAWAVIYVKGKYHLTALVSDFPLRRPGRFDTMFGRMCAECAAAC